MEIRTILPAVLVATVLLGYGVSCIQGTTEFVLIHGGGHGAWCWYKVATRLQAAGYKTTALDLASAGTRDKISADSIATVAQNTKPLTDYLANVSGQVVLVGHSLGGISISVAMEQYPAKISHAIFLAAVMPKNNQSFTTSTLPSTTPRLVAANVFSPNFGNGPNAPPTSVTLNLTVAPQYFYNRSPATDITLSLTLLDNVPFIILSEVLFLTATNYGSVRRFYLQCDDDQIFGPGGEEYVIANNPPEKTFFINGSDHSAFFSKPVVTTELIVKISNL